MQYPGTITKMYFTTLISGIVTLWLLKKIFFLSIKILIYYILKLVPDSKIYII